MNTTLAKKPVNYLKMDGDGNVYAVPEHEVFSFTMAVEEVQNADWGSDEWGKACDDLHLNFGQYRKE